MAKDTEISEDVEDGEAAAARPSRKPMMIALVLTVLLGGGGFYAAYSGLAPSPASLMGGGKAKDDKKDHASVDSGIGFMALGELIVPLSPRANAKFLVMEAEIEVAQAELAAIEQLRPRILDMFNTYLRAIDESDFSDPAASLRLRAQLLRRLSVVADPVKPRDLLITSFILR